MDEIWMNGGWTGHIFNWVLVPPEPSVRGEKCSATFHLWVSCVFL
jgi:hypothetical protein